MPKEKLSRSGVWGEQITSLQQASTIKKGGPTREGQGCHHLARVDYAQGKGIILIGFLFYRSRSV